MVYFTCNHCGESLKKAAVEKHYQFKACRNGPIFLTCADCLKDFREQEYVAHTKCVSEAERYAAKGSYVAKPDKIKGAQKQEIWTECIQELSERPKIDKTLRNILERIAAQSNVPRKKPKFINFLKSSMKYNVHQAEKVWTIIEDGLEEFKKRSAPIQTPTAALPVSSSNEAEVSSTTDVTTAKNEHDDDTQNDCQSSMTNKSSTIVHLNAALDHALGHPDLPKMLKKTLKKLKKQATIPLDAKPPKKKKFIKLLQEKLELDADNSLAVWECISVSIDALGQTKENASAGVQVNGSKKRKTSETKTENNEAEPKRPKIQNGTTNEETVDGDDAFDWQQNIIRIFQKNQNDNQIAIDLLRSKVIKKFLKAAGQDGTDGGKEHFKKFKKHLKKVDRLVIAGNLVQLKA